MPLVYCGRELNTRQILFFDHPTTPPPDNSASKAESLTFALPIPSASDFDVTAT